MRIFDRRFPGNLRRYFGQVFLATVVLGIVLAIQDAAARAAVVTAIASSAFLAFVTPNSVMAQPRRLMGGHATGVVVGSLFSLLIFDSPAASFLGDYSALKDVTAAGAVGVAMLTMAITNTEHPPAAGTVLGLVIVPWSFRTVILVLIAAAILSGAKAVLRRWLIDLA